MVLLVFFSNLSLYGKVGFFFFTIASARLLRWSWRCSTCLFWISLSIFLEIHRCLTMIGKVSTGGRVVMSIPPRVCKVYSLASETLMPFARFKQTVQNQRVLTALDKTGDHSNLVEKTLDAFFSEYAIESPSSLSIVSYCCGVFGECEEVVDCEWMVFIFDSSL